MLYQTKKQTTMQTTILITGQLAGNSTLASAIYTYECEQSRTMFGGYNITFPTKAKAKKALWQAYKYLRSNEPEFAKSGISYKRHGYLKYDASIAKIID